MSEVGLDVREQLLMAELVRLEVDAAAVAEAEIDRGAPACGLGPRGVELAPGAEDLIDLRLLVPSLSP